MSARGDRSRTGQPEDLTGPNHRSSASCKSPGSRDAWRTDCVCWAAAMGSAARVRSPAGLRADARQGTNLGEPGCGLPAYPRVAVAAWVMRALPLPAGTGRWSGCREPQLRLSRPVPTWPAGQAGGIIRSSLATRYQLGLIRQEASVIVPPSAFTPQGTWESAMKAAFARCPTNRSSPPTWRQGWTYGVGPHTYRRSFS
jgi:hypothetical protein